MQHAKQVWQTINAQLFLTLDCYLTQLAFCTVEKQTHTIIAFATSHPSDYLHVMDLSAISKDVEHLISKAGVFILGEVPKIKQQNIREKSLNNLLTYVDETSEKMLGEQLTKIIPGSTIWGEEGIAKREKSKYTWIIDPLDGTTNFLFGMPVYAISIALMVKDEVVAGWVSNVPQDELFTAIKGKGAFLNGQKIEVSQRKNLSECLIGTGFPVKEFERVDDQMEVTNQLIRSTRGVRRLGAAAVDLCYIACGRFDAFFECNLSPWDVAAGLLIIEEAGGKTVDFSGKSFPLSGREIIATNASVYNEFYSIVSRGFKGSKPKIDPKKEVF